MDKKKMYINGEWILHSMKQENGEIWTPRKEAT